MKQKVFSVFDSAVNAYQRPFLLQSKGEAVRAFIEISNDPQSQICKYPADFTLFEIAEYDDQTGKFSNLNTPVSCGLAIEYKKEKGSVVPTPERHIDLATKPQ